MQIARLIAAVSVGALLVAASVAAAAPQSKQKPAPKKAAKPAQASKKVVTTKSGLKYVDLVVGKGASPKPGQTVVVDYTGWLTNGKKFDSSKDHGQRFEFVIGQGNVIKGWDEGVMSMKIGGKRKLTVPPNLGYGERGAGGGVIPPNATLLFEVELYGIK